MNTLTRKASFSVFDRGHLAPTADRWGGGQKMQGLVENASPGCGTPVCAGWGDLAVSCWTRRYFAVDASPTCSERAPCQVPPTGEHLVSQRLDVQLAEDVGIRVGSRCAGFQSFVRGLTLVLFQPADARR